MTTMTQPQSSKEWMTNFFVIWTGQAFSIVGSELVQFALIWWLTDTTGSAKVLAMALLVGKIPRIVLGPFVGTLVDRWKRRIIMIVADGMIALATVGLSVLFAIGAVQIWQVYLLMFIRAMGSSFHGPAMRASTSLMVPKEHLPRIQGVNQLLNGGVNIIAAPLSALLLLLLPMQSILMIDVVTALLAITPLLFIAVPQPERRLLSKALGGKVSFWQDFRAGFEYMWGWPGLKIIALMAAVGNLLLSPTLMLLPILVTKHFGGAAVEIGWAEAAFSLGVVIGSSVLGVWGGSKRLIMTMLVALLALGIGMLVVGFIPASTFALLLGAMLFVGAVLPMFNGPLMAIMQGVVAPEIQGRVFTLFSSVTMAMVPLGAAIVGPVADSFGMQICYIVTGIVLVLMGIVAFFIPAVMHIEEQKAGVRPV
jgi:DHA3 family macrolide efflux protein-like MFS transporter